MKVKNAVLMCVSSLAILLALSVTAIRAQNQGQSSDPWVGTWNLDIAGSQFNPGPPPQSETIVIDKDGHFQLSTIEANGQKAGYEVDLRENSDAPIPGIPSASVRHRIIDARTFEYTWKFGDATLVGISRLNDGDATFTFTVKGVNFKGKQIDNVLLFDRQK